MINLGVKMQVTRDLFNDVMVPNYNPSAVIPVRGEGSRVWDQNNNEFIDFAGGIAVNCLLGSVRMPTQGSSGCACIAFS